METAIKVPAKRVRKAPVKEPVKQRKEKQYRLLHYQPLSFILKVGRNNLLLIFDEEKGYNRAIRHCPNEKSIYVDEQSKVAVVRPIVFLNGLLNTKATEVITQEFLDKHPKNGKVYSVVDEAADAQEISDTIETRLDAKQAIRTKSKEKGGIEELRVIVSVLNNNVATAAKMSSAEIKTALYSLIDSNIHRFINRAGEITIFDDPEIQRQALALHSFNSGVVRTSVDGSKIIWTDNKETICLIPTGKSAMEYFASYLGTEEGLQVAVEVSKR